MRALNKLRPARDAASLVRGHRASRPSDRKRSPPSRVPTAALTRGSGPRTGATDIRTGHREELPIVNLGPATFEIDAERGSANGRPLDPVSLDLRPGDVVAFDCKHQHRVLDADPARRSVVLWRLKRFPPTPVEPVAIP